MARRASSTNLVKLTKTGIAAMALEPGQSERIVWDAETPGLGLRMRASGNRVWVLRPPRQGGKSVIFTLGGTDVLTLAEARAAARERMAKATLGDDPHAARREARAQAAVTMGAVVGRYMERCCSGHGIGAQMAAGDFVAYYRVSTQRQGRSGLGLDAQKEAVRAYLNGGAWNLVAEVIEVESGKRSDRPQLTEALRLCRRHRATLVIAKLDRLARNVAFTSNLMESSVEFVAVDNPHATRLTIHVLAAVAEHEAAMISARTKAALAQAKLRGVKLGGDRGNLPAVAEAGRRLSATRRAAMANAHAADLRPDIDAIRADGIVSLNGIANELNRRGVPLPRYGAWTATSVRRALARIEAA